MGITKLPFAFIFYCLSSISFVGCSPYTFRASHFVLFFAIYYHHFNTIHRYYCCRCCYCCSCLFVYRSFQRTAIVVVVDAVVHVHINVCDEFLVLLKDTYAMNWRLSLCRNSQILLLFSIRLVRRISIFHLLSGKGRKQTFLLLYLH